MEEAKQLTEEERKQRNKERREKRKKQIQEGNKVVKDTQEKLREQNGQRKPNTNRAWDLLGKEENQPLVKEFDDYAQKPGSLRRLYQIAGKNVLKEYARKNRDGEIRGRLTKAQMRDLQAIIGDDFWSTVAPYLLEAAKIGGTSLLNYAVPKFTEIVRSSKPYEWIRNKLQAFGSDLLNDHDRQNVFSNGPKVVIGQSENISRSSYSAVGVNVNAIKAAIHPSKYCARFPVDVRATGVMCKPSMFTLTTNAAGNAACIIQPYNLFMTTYYGGIMNDVTYSPTTGAQTPPSTAITAPYAGLGTSVDGFSLVGFEIKIQRIVSYLENKGYFRASFSHEGMSDAPFIGGTDNSFLTEQQMLAQPYAVAGPISDLVMTFSFIPPASDMFDFHNTVGAIWGSATNLDHAFQAALQIIGAAASTQVAIITVYPLIQFTPNKTTVQLIDLSVADPGIYSKHFCEQLIAFNKNVCLFGEEELNALCQSFDTCQPDFDSLFKVAMLAQTKMVNQSTGFTSRIGTLRRVGGLRSGNPLFQDPLKQLEKLTRQIEQLKIQFKCIETKTEDKPDDKPNKKEERSKSKKVQECLDESD